MKYLPFLLASVFTLTTNYLTGQNESKALVSFHENRVFVGVANPFRVVIQQLEPVSLDQLSAVLQTYGEEKEPTPIPLAISQTNYGFSVRSAELGLVEITVTLNDGTKEQYSFRTKPLPAAPRVGNYGPKTTGQVKTNVFKSQRGLYAQIEGFDISAKCKVISYELIHITSGKDAEIVFNEGGNFQLKAINLIRAAKPGDRYIFTKIRYRCPGALEDQLGETLSFELK